MELLLLFIFFCIGAALLFCFLQIAVVGGGALFIMMLIGGIIIVAFLVLVGMSALMAKFEQSIPFNDINNQRIERQISQNSELIPYRNRFRAQLAADDHMETNGATLWVYYCKCSKYHLTDRKPASFFGYKNRDDAEEAAQRKNPVWRVYHCDGCSKWHITSKLNRSSDWIDVDEILEFFLRFKRKPRPPRSCAPD